MTNTMFDRIHIKVYEEILCGRFKPDLDRFNDMEEPINLVMEANSFRVATLPQGQNLLEYVEKTDFTGFGFKDSRDFEIDTKELNSGRTDVFVRPLKIYDLKEAMDIPLFLTIKNSSFLQLISDQFERIKIRAEYALENESDDKNIKSYATRHIQKAKKLFYDGKILLKDMQHKQDPENIYIIFMLNTFLIRTILFYEKMFHPYTNQEKLDMEDQMKMELIACLSMSRLSHIFHLTDTGYCCFLKKSMSEKTDDIACEPSVKYANSSKTFSNKKSDAENADGSGVLNSQNETGRKKTFFDSKNMPDNQDVQMYNKLKWNGQINVLMDMFLQCMEEQRVSGNPLLETSYQDLKNFVLANFCDKKGNDLSYHTINTILDPKRFDKRLHPESPKRIDVAKIIKR